MQRLHRFASVVAFALLFASVAAASITGAAILPKSAGTTPTARILALVPSEAWLRLTGGVMVRVGTYLDEAVVPAMALVERGVELVFASPSGNKPPLDPHSNQSSYFNNNETAYLAAVKFWDTYPPLQNPRRLTDFAPEDPDAAATTVAPELATFDGVFVPGGHAPIIDLWPSTAVGRIVNYFFQNGKRASGGPTLVTAICHGPISLAAASLLPGLEKSWPFAGRNMTIFSTAEEKISQAAKWDNRTIGFYPQEVLTALGGNVSAAAPWTAHVVADGNLITGQNPQSADLLAGTIVSWLNLN